MKANEAIELHHVFAVIEKYQELVQLMRSLTKSELLLLINASVYYSRKEGAERGT